MENLTLSEQFKEQLKDACPYIYVSFDNIIAANRHFIIKGNLQRREDWPHGIWQNSPYFMFTVDVMNNGKITLSIYSKGIGMPKFRKKTVSDIQQIEKLIVSLKNYISENLNEFNNNPEKFKI